MKKLLISPLLLALCLIATPSLADGFPELKQAQALVKAGKASQAYALLSPLEDQYAGDPDYDYLLGISALDSGNPSRAVFALERLTAERPSYPQGRAELARAYYELGEKSSARDEFNAVLATNPPPEAAATIRRYLSAIEQAPGNTHYFGHLEYTLGYDTNVNSATSDLSVAVPGLGGLVFQYNPGATRQGDSFNSFGFGAGLYHPLENGFAIQAGLSHVSRFNSEQTAFSTGTLDTYLGLSKNMGQDTLSLTLQNSQLDLDSNGYRHAYGLNVQWRRDLSATSQFSAYLQAGRVHYPGQSTRDVNRSLVGVGYAKALNGQWSPVFFLGGYAGEESAQYDVASVGNRFEGLRAGGQLTFNPRLSGYANLSAEHRHYRGQDAFFLITRSDQQYDLSLGLRYTLMPGLTLNPAIAYTNNSTNYLPSDYQRTVASVTLRKDFSQ